MICITQLSIWLAVGYSWCIRCNVRNFEKDISIDIMLLQLQIRYLVSSIVISSILFIFNSFYQMFGSSVFGTVVIFASLELILKTNKEIISAPIKDKKQEKGIYFFSLTQSLTYYLIAILLINIGYKHDGLIYANLISSAAIQVYLG